MNLDEINHAEDKIIGEYKQNFPNVLQELRPASHYVVSYPSLLKATRRHCKRVNLNQESKADAIYAITHMTYGWMRRILTYCDITGEKHENGLTILDAYQIQTCQQAIEFVQGFEESPINTEGAWVGLSKALHFINPKCFPIWNSNVAKNFGTDPYGEHGKQKYICYIEWSCSVLNPTNDA